MAGDPWAEFRVKDDPWAEFRVQQSAPEAMAPQGVPAPAVAAKTGPSVAEDVAKQSGIGLAKGVIGAAGLPGDIPTWIEAGLNKGNEFLVSKGLAQPRSREQVLPKPPGAADIQKTVEGYTGEFRKPQTTAGKYAQTIGEFVPGIAMGPGGLARRALTQVLAPAVASEAAGQATEGTALEPYARVGGALAGGVGAGALTRAITPNPISAERQAMVKALRNEGVTDLTAGQKTGRKGLQYYESEMGGGRTADMIERQGEQLTGAALRRGNENASRALPEVVDQAFTRIGKNFDDVAARSTLQVDQTLAGDLVDIAKNYTQMVGPSQRAPIVENFLNDLTQKGNVIDGAVYQANRSRLDRAARSSRADPQLSEALFGIRNALDDAMERSLQAAGKTADMDAWRQARREYRNMLVIEKAATGAGSDTAMGIISPSQLRRATVTQNRRDYARGHGDFAELARAAEAIMKPLPNSGTAPRMRAQGVSDFIGGTMGGGLGALLGAAGGPLGSGAGALAGAAAGMAAPRIAGRAAMSGPMQVYLANQLIGQGGPTNTSAMTRAMARALLGYQSSQGR